jgi:PhzF family phenazine biosynthesis protein
MKIPIFQVDAFTDKIFEGNPAAVCPLDEWIELNLMQKIASENNLSETAFFVKGKEGYDLRWFTPKMEQELCGHATLAAAHVLYEHLGFEGEYIRFFTRSGRLSVKKEEDLYVMNFPSRIAEPVGMPDDLMVGLGLETPPVKVLKDMNYLVLLESSEQVRELRPNFKILSRINYAGIICTAPGNNHDFVSRFFSPYAGINEDPVTGSSHTTLTSFWAKELGKKELIARQVSKRGGTLYCKYLGDRTDVGGKAKTYLTGEIYL